MKLWVGLLCSIAIILFPMCVVTFADGPPSKNAPVGKRLIVREVCRISDKEQYRRNGSLTFDGKELIVVEPHKKLSLYKVNDLSECVVASNPMILNAWSDSATGGIFVLMDSDKTGSKDEGKRRLTFSDLLYFVDINSMLDWNPKWTKKRIVRDSSKEQKELEIQWISGAQLFFMNRRASPEFTFIDPEGKDAGGMKLPGLLYGGFDTSDEGIEVYFLSNDSPTPFVMRGIIDSKHEKFQRTERLFQSRFRAPFLHGVVDEREIRLRGLKSGDVRRYVEWTNQPTFWQRLDHENIGLEPAHLESLRRADTAGSPRSGEMGKLSYAESDTEYEIVMGRHAGSWRFPSFVYRRSGELIMLPVGPFPSPNHVADAVLSNDSWAVSLVSRANDGRGKIESTFFVCTLSESP